MKRATLVGKMPARTVTYVEDGFYHLYNRGAAKLPIYLGPEDYGDFLDIARYFLTGFPIMEVPGTSKTKQEKLHIPVSYKADPQGNGLFQNSLDVLAYCLMPNHFHFLVRLESPETKSHLPEHGSSRNFQTIPEFIKRLCITYTHKFNYRHKRQGVLWQGRFCVKHVTTDSYALQLMRYIHLNPHTSKLVSTPEQWPYSDYELYASHGSSRNFRITKPDFLRQFFRSPSEYREFVRGGIAPDEAAAIEPLTIDHDADEDVTINGSSRNF